MLSRLLGVPSNNYNYKYNYSFSKIFKLVDTPKRHILCNGRVTYDPKQDKDKEINSKTGGALIYDKLVTNDVKHAFLFSGGSVMPIIDQFYDGPIKYYINTHEQNCGHAATGYAKSTGTTGVCLVTSGPGITNMITPMLDATNDSTPLVVISGQVPLSVSGSNAFQEAPAVELSKCVTKWSYQIQDVREIDIIIDTAFKVANNGKKGAVHIDVPKCISSQRIDTDNFFIKNKNKNKNIIQINSLLPKLDEPELPEDLYIQEIASVINKSQKPIIYLGQGCIEAYKELRQFVDIAKIPVTSTIHGLGIYNDHNDLSLRWCGMHGLAAANYALQEADCIIALGSRFDDRTTGNVSLYAPAARKNKAIIHVNIESSEINKVLDTNYNIVGDCDVFLDYITPHIEDKYRDKWLKRIGELKKRYPFELKKSSNKIKLNDNNYKGNNYKRNSYLGKRLRMEEVIDSLYRNTLYKPVIFTTGVGNHQMQAYQFIKCQYPRKILSSGSLGVMGAGLPYAIGAQIANPDKLVIDIDGDSSFNMTLSDLKTIKEHNLPVKIAVMNNNAQMMVTIWEKLFFDERLTATINERNPEYTKLAESFGIKSMKCQYGDNLDEKIEEFINYPGPILCEFSIERDICLPLVSPGKALDEMILPDDKSVDIDSGLVPS